MWYWNNWRLGKYDLVRKIGSGGMSSVFKAIDRESDRSVAVKVLPPGLDEEESFKARFEREARILMRLRHPNIVPILDFGEVDGVYYIVMPLMEVGTLRERINSGPLKPEEGANIVRQIAEALQYAHDMDLVHRDVKPSNILLDEDGNAWLSDFGTARVLDATANLTGSSLIGTPQYMSPEQARGDPVTPLADVYALGVVLYQMSTGQLPFNAESPLAIAMKHASEPLPHPNAINPNLPEAIAHVLIKALEKRPEDRYPSATSLSGAFQQALDDVYDPHSGRLKPGAIKPYDATLEYKPGEAEVEEATDVRPPSKRRSIRLAALLSAIALIPLLWVAARALNNPAAADGGAPAVTASATIDWKATVDALSTAVAFSAGANVSEDQLQTAIASTLQAMVIESGLSPETPAVILTPGNDQTATSIAENTSIAQATSTAAAALGTQFPTASITPSRTLTLVPGVTPSRTLTLVPGVTPSRTPTPSRTATSQPSPTRTATGTTPPTSTNPPTATQIPSSTPTTRPSNTPTPDVCPLISIGGFRTNSTIAEWTISNGTGSPIVIEEINLDWPASNFGIFNVFLDGTLIWASGDPSPPTYISNFIGSKSDRQVDSSGVLEALFGNDAASSGYSLEIRFDNGCRIK